jgi:uncharacterized protein YgbK (DUF1537 family)
MRAVPLTIRLGGPQVAHGPLRRMPLGNASAEYVAPHGMTAVVIAELIDMTRNQIEALLRAVANLVRAGLQSG